MMEMGIDREDRPRMMRIRRIDADQIRMNPLNPCDPRSIPHLTL